MTEQFRLTNQDLARSSLELLPASLPLHSWTTISQVVMAQLYRIVHIHASNHCNSGFLGIESTA